MANIPASYVYERDYEITVQQYEHKDHGRFLLVRVGSKAVLSMGFDMQPERALELAEALTKHAKELIAKTEAEAAAQTEAT
jgi:hypothetical protein